MTEIPRFSIREVNQVARHIESICERKGDEFTLLLVRESWLRALIERGKTEIARRIFQEEIDRLPHLPYVGALHQALIYKSGAHLAWQQSDMAAWKVYISRAVNLMYQAGLAHQLSQVRHTYGNALEPVLAMLAPT